MGLCKSFLCTLTDIYPAGAGGADHADQLRYVRGGPGPGSGHQHQHNGSTNYKSKQ